MGALNIAFDTTIIGALALPWVVLVIHLFFVEDESGIKKAISWINKKRLTTVAGVLLFGMAFALGSGVSRSAWDFFNDDDLHIDICKHAGAQPASRTNGPCKRFRVGLTEDGLRSKVYCENRDLLALSHDRKIADLPALEDRCQHPLAWSLTTPDDKAKDEKDKDEKDKDRVSRIFYLQESAIQLEGQEKTEKVRQLHDQVFVLRGAAFNGFVAFTLCLFAWGAGLSSNLRWAMPIGVLIPAFIALHNHFKERPIADPPFMEFTLLLLGASGVYLLRKGSRLRKQEQVEQQPVPRKLPVGLPLVSLLLTIAAFMAWWSTETLYCNLVIDTYYADAHHLPD